MFEPGPYIYHADNLVSLVQLRMCYAQRSLCGMERSARVFKVIMCPGMGTLGLNALRIIDRRCLCACYLRRLSSNTSRCTEVSRHSSGELRSSAATASSQGEIACMNSSYYLKISPARHHIDLVCSPILGFSYIRKSSKKQNYPHDRKGGGLVVCPIKFLRNSLRFREISNYYPFVVWFVLHLGMWCRPFIPPGSIAWSLIGAHP